MAILPEPPSGSWDDFAPIFTRPTFRRFLTLLGAAVLTVGRRTVANLLRTAESLAAGAASSYRRVFSQARWSSLHLACVLARRVVALLPADGPIMLAAMTQSGPGPCRCSWPCIAARPTTAASGTGIAGRRSTRSGCCG